VSLARTHQEMNAVYQSLAEQGKGGDPYVLTYEHNEQGLVFFGSVHSNDLENIAQWSAFDQSWEAFLAYPGEKLLVHENTMETLESTSRETAITEHGEIGLAMWRAQDAGITTVSGEPDRASELANLKQQFSESEIMTYYFARQMHQWHRADYVTSPDWQSYAQHMLTMYLTVPGWTEKPSLDVIVQNYERTAGKPFEPHDTEAFYALSDPSQNPVSAASGTYRDETLLARIVTEWQADKNIFVVYGSGHAIVLEPALKELVDAN
jgi:hypothetical protein